MAHANLNDTITSLQPFFSFPQIKWKGIFCTPTVWEGSFRGFLTKEKRRRRGILVFWWLLSNDIHTVVVRLLRCHEGHIIPVFSFMPRLMASSTLALLLLCCCATKIEPQICTKTATLPGTYTTYTSILFHKTVNLVYKL